MFHSNNRLFYIGHMKLIRYSYIIGIFIISAISCANPENSKCIKNNIIFGKSDGLFTSRWYDYYERALSYMKGECYQYAIEDLNKAIQIEYKDERWVKTYGMHFMDYFPHREKGIIHYLIGEYYYAEKELSLSIEQEISAKAEILQKNILLEAKRYLPIQINYFLQIAYH